MAEFEIIPPEDPRVLCKFTVPRKGKSALVFDVKRMEYLSAQENEAFDDWFRQRTSPVDVVDDDGKPVLVNGVPEVRSPEFLGTRELCLKSLEFAGVHKAKLTQVEKLTTGEITQIWDRWREASRMTLGESEASAASSPE